MLSVGIVDYGLGNLGSLLNMFRKIGVNAGLVQKEQEIFNVSHLVLPGVGSFDAGMHNLNESGITSILGDAVLKHKIPILGICLGAQLMLDSSEEGVMQGLGWIEGRAVKFEPSDKIKVPHMGWNSLVNTEGSFLFRDMPHKKPRFYFVHSYYFQLANRVDISSESHYGIPFCASFQRENVMGVQFHPEKSHLFGMTLLQNFLTIA